MEGKFKKGLGRGLSSLLGENTEKEIETNKVAIKDIVRNNSNQEKILVKKI